MHVFTHYTRAQDRDILHQELDTLRQERDSFRDELGALRVVRVDADGRIAALEHQVEVCSCVTMSRASVYPRG